MKKKRKNKNMKNENAYNLMNIELLEKQKQKLENDIKAHNDNVNWIINEYFDLRIKTAY